MEFKARLVSWNEIVDWCLSIRKEIVNSYSPEIIIALSRGGLVPGRLLSDYLWIKDLYTIKTEHWGITASTPVSLPFFLIIGVPPPPVLTGRKFSLRRFIMTLFSRTCHRT